MDAGVKIIDSRGAACPGPITDLARAYRNSKVGDIFEMWATDKGEKKMIMPKEFEHMGQAMMEGMAREHVASWYSMIKEAKEFGAKVYACSMACGVMGIKR